MFPINFDYIEPILFFIGIVQILRNRLGAVFMIILFLFESGFFVGTALSSFLFTHNIYDTGVFLLLLAIVRLALREPGYDLRPLKWFRWGVIVFFLFVVITSSVDLIVNEVDPSSVFKFFRRWIIFVLFFFIDRIRSHEITAFLRYFVIIAVCFAFTYIIEYEFSMPITGARFKRHWRASVQSWTVIFVFELLLMGYFRVGKVTKWVCAAIILGEIILSASRSGFIAFVIAGGSAMVFASSISLLRKLLLISTMAIGLVVLFASDNSISKRFDDAGEDMQSIDAGSKEVVGNFSFRMLLFAERANYISQDPQRIVFGVGSIQEKDFPTTFLIGLNDEEHHRPTQLDTGDIAWATLVLRLGFVGTLIYVFAVFVPFIIYCYKRRREVIPYCLLIYTLVSLLLISFTYKEIAASYFWLMPIILLTSSLPPRQVPSRH